MRSTIFLIVVSAIFLVMSCSDDSVCPRNDSGDDNNPPVITAQNDTSITVGDTLRLFPSATDPDGDPLTFGGFVHVTLSDIRNGTLPNYEFKGDPGHLEFVPQGFDAPSRKATLHVNDGRGGADSTTFTILVN